MEDLDDEVGSAFAAAIDKLAAAGADIDEQPMPLLDECDDLFVERPLVPWEVWQHHREMLRLYLEEYDPFVGRRMSAGADIDAEEQHRRMAERDRLVAEFRRRFAESGADALLYPTVACVPPAIAATDDVENARRINLRCLRNTATVNYFDGCAISLPCHPPGGAPVGMMLSSVNGDDDRLYRFAAAVEATLASPDRG
jgi:aspartyl-tRNA(Asn)/glutamyl-tRNA(Gln) amidotransferase subunit A